jgi:hypothetical protein
MLAHQMSDWFVESGLDCVSVEERRLMSINLELVGHNSS